MFMLLELVVGGEIYIKGDFARVRGCWSYLSINHKSSCMNFIILFYERFVFSFLYVFNFRGSMFKILLLILYTLESHQVITDRYLRIGCTRIKTSLKFTWGQNCLWVEFEGTVQVYAKHVQHISFILVQLLHFKSHYHVGHFEFTSLDSNLGANFHHHLLFLVSNTMKIGILLLFFSCGIWSQSSKYLWCAQL